MRKEILLLISTSLLLTACSFGQPLHGKRAFTHQDTLRGTITPERAWWDVTRYDISVTPNYESKSIVGKNVISFKTLYEQPKNHRMQIDLQEPMVIDSIVYRNSKLPFEHDQNVWMVNWSGIDIAKESKITIHYHGTPRQAVNPPWDGGWIWKTDQQGRQWMSVACQGLGASVWYPCKDHQSDEPDNGASLSMTVANDLVAVANGRMIKKTSANNLTTYTWEVKNPINNYDIIPYIGSYVNFSDTLMGEKGKLDLNYWVLDYDLPKAKKQFEQVKPMLRAFEYWMGPYPFYEDGYKLVEAPHLGMEHQSAVAYGNKFMNGYLGTDLSGTGYGLKWDYIIVHESGHEWFGNNITTNDIADMWVHEGFTDYTEALYINYHYGKIGADKYVQGLRKNIQNDNPIIGPYGVNQEGSGDMYYKGANLLHMIRTIIDNDEQFRQILRGLNKNFYHKTVTSAEVEQYISRKCGKDLSKVFDQYLRTTEIPKLELKVEEGGLRFRWSECIEGFNMPVKLTNGKWIYATTTEEILKGVKVEKGLKVDENFYVRVGEGN